MSRDYDDTRVRDAHREESLRGRAQGDVASQNGDNGRSQNRSDGWAVHRFNYIFSCRRDIVANEHSFRIIWGGNSPVGTSLYMLIFRRESLRSKYKKSLNVLKKRGLTS